jgi:hypothetical protein
LKKAEDLAEGKFRAGKRRNRGLGVDDDGDSDEDEEDSMRRRAMHSKKRRIDGDGLDALGECSRGNFADRKLKNLMMI